MLDLNNNTFGIKKEIGKRIDFIRIEKNISKSDFAKLLNISFQHLSQVINGENGLSIEKVIELSNKTGYSTDFILLGKKSSINSESKDLLKQAKTNIQDLNKKIDRIISLIE